MLNIKFEAGRENGEYFIELTKNRGLDIVNCDRLGYWCDKPHLVHMGLEILAMFNHYELFAKLLKDEKIPAAVKEKPENNRQQLKAKMLQALWNSENDQLTMKEFRLKYPEFEALSAIE